MARSLHSIGPTVVAHALEGLTFPAGKPELVAHASRRGAEPEVLALLQDMPEGEYSSISDVRRAVGVAVE